MPGHLAKRGQEFLRAGAARLLYVPPAQTAKDLAKVGLVVVGAVALSWLALRWLRNSGRSD